MAHDITRLVALAAAVGIFTPPATSILTYPPPVFSNSASLHFQSFERLEGLFRLDERAVHVLLIGRCLGHLELKVLLKSA
eukprot:g21422.t1